MTHSDQTTYVTNPDLSVIREGWKGNSMVGKQFDNKLNFEKGFFKNVLKWQFSKNPQEEKKQADTFRVEVSSDRGYLDTDEDVIVWLDHASFFIRLNGTVILTDPCFYFDTARTLCP